jgi:aspartate aminotransferase
MTGWRIGYLGANRELVSAMQKLQSQCTSNPCSIAQAAACEGLSNPLAYSTIKQMVEQFKIRHDYIYNFIKNNTNGLLSMLPADGAFYGFIDFIGKVEE